MCMMDITITSMMLLWLIPLAAWEMFWKGYGMWKAGRNNQFGWFLAILIFNTAGILPIIYLFLIQKKTEQPKTRRKR